MVGNYTSLIFSILAIFLIVVANFNSIAQISLTNGNLSVCSRFNNSIVCSNQSTFKTIREENPQANSKNVDLSSTGEGYALGLSIIGKGVQLLAYTMIILCLLSYGKMTVTPLAKKVNTYPTIGIYPMLGSCHYFFGPLENVFQKLSDSFNTVKNRMFSAWVFHIPLLVIADANAVQAVIESWKHVEKAGFYKPTLNWFLQDGLVTSAAHIWKEDRALLNPFFKFQRFDGFLTTINEKSKIMVELLSHTLNQGEKSPLNLHPFLLRFGMDSISDAALGINTSYQHDPENDFLKNTHNSNKAIASRFTRPWLSLPIISQISGTAKLESDCIKYYRDNLTPVIANRRQLRASSFEDNEDIERPFIDALLDDGKKDEQIISHVITIFVAGFETTAGGMNYTLFLLAILQNYQEKVHEELDRIFQADRNRSVTFKDLSEMKYLEMCIQESMRIYPPVPFMGRAIQSDIQLENGRVIPKGCDVLISIYHLHRDPQSFPDPETFNPDRFRSEECKGRSAYAYIPFSAGPRFCIGRKYAMMQMKTALSFILRNFRVTTEQTREQVKVLPSLVLEPSGSGIKLILHKRT